MPSTNYLDETSEKKRPQIFGQRRWDHQQRPLGYPTAGCWLAQRVIPFSLFYPRLLILKKARPGRTRCSVCSRRWNELQRLQPRCRSVQPGCRLAQRQLEPAVRALQMSGRAVKKASGPSQGSARERQDKARGPRERQGTPGSAQRCQRSARDARAAPGSARAPAGEHVARVR